jgi:hypothetical protein
VGYGGSVWRGNVAVVERNLDASTFPIDPECIVTPVVGSSPSASAGPPAHVAAHVLALLESET